MRIHGRLDLPVIRQALIARPFICSIWLLLGACAPAYSTAPANRVTTVSPGDRLRVTHSGQCCTSPAIGIEQSLDRDSLVMRPESGNGQVAIARSSITQIERWNPGPRHVGAGAVIGLFVGTAAGALIAYGGGHSYEEKQLQALGGAVLGAGLGVAAGIFIGARHHGFWEAVPGL